MECLTFIGVAGFSFRSILGGLVVAAELGACTDETVDIVEIGRDGLAGGTIATSLSSAWCTFGFSLRSTTGASVCWGKI